VTPDEFDIGVLTVIATLVGSDLGQPSLRPRSKNTSQSLSSSARMAGMFHCFSVGEFQERARDVRDLSPMRSTMSSRGCRSRSPGVDPRRGSLRVVGDSIARIAAAGHTGTDHGPGVDQKTTHVGVEFGQRR